MKMWRIAEFADEGKFNQGDLLIAINLPINLIIEYNNGGFVYHTLMSDTTSRKPVVLDLEDMETEFGWAIE